MCYFKSAPKWSFISCIDFGSTLQIRFIRVNILGSAFVYYQMEVTATLLSVVISSKFVRFFTPIWRHNYVKCIINHLHFKDSISFSGRWQTWRSINFNQPWLEIIIDQNVESVDLKAVSVVYNYALNTFQTYEYNIFDSFKEFFARLFASRLFYIKSHIFNGPFATVLLVVAISKFLNRNICQVNHHVVQLCNVGCVFFCTKSCEAPCMKIGF